MSNDHSPYRSVFLSTNSLGKYLSANSQLVINFVSLLFDTSQVEFFLLSQQSNYKDV